MIRRGTQSSVSGLLFLPPTPALVLLWFPTSILLALRNGRISHTLALPMHGTFTHPSHSNMALVHTRLRDGNGVARYCRRGVQNLGPSLPVVTSGVISAFSPAHSPTPPDTSAPLGSCHLSTVASAFSRNSFILPLSYHHRQRLINLPTSNVLPFRSRRSPSRCSRFVRSGHIGLAYGCARCSSCYGRVAARLGSYPAASDH